MTIEQMSLPFAEAAQEEQSLWNMVEGENANQKLANVTDSLAAEPDVAASPYAGIYTELLAEAHDRITVTGRGNYWLDQHGEQPLRLDKGIARSFFEQAEKAKPQASQPIDEAAAASSQPAALELDLERERAADNSDQQPQQPSSVRSVAANKPWKNHETDEDGYSRTAKSSRRQPVVASSDTSRRQPSRRATRPTGAPAPRGEEKQQPAGSPDFDAQVKAQVFAVGGEEGYLEYVTGQKRPTKELAIRLPTALDVRRSKNGDPLVDQTGRETYREKLDEDLLNKLAYALQDYIDLSARRERTFIIGQKGNHRPRYLQDKDGEYLRDEHNYRIEEHTTEARATAKAVEAARQLYEELRREAKGLSRKAMEPAGFSSAELLLRSKLDDETEVKYIAAQIDLRRQDLARPKGEGRWARRQQKFYDWWVRQGGGHKFLSKDYFKHTGSWKKAGVVFVAGLPAGILAGALLPVAAPAAGIVLGAGAAAGAARGYGRGLAVGKLTQNAADATMAHAQAEVRSSAQLSYSRAAYSEGRIPESVTDAFKQATAKEVRRNRSRVAIAAGAGAIGGAAGLPIGMVLHAAAEYIPWPHMSWPFGHGGTGHHRAVGKARPDHSGAPEPNQHGGLGHRHISTSQPDNDGLQPQGKQFQVEHGSGEILEIQQYAASRNHPISTSRAGGIWRSAHAKFNDHVVNLDHTTHDVYHVRLAHGQLDTRLSRPGPAHWWSRGVEQLIDNEIVKPAA